MRKRRICYVTGTRAEFGLMRSALKAIRSRSGLELQLIVTGMHLSHEHGRSIRQVRRAGFEIDAKIRWYDTSDKSELAEEAAIAQVKMARAFADLNPDIVLVCGDRVEAFAAAAAAHLGGRLVAHVHGGDRALGQIDDALRHAISKLSHIHLCATQESKERLFAMGEDDWRIHCVGTPGLDRIVELSQKKPCDPIDALVLLHPDSSDPVEQLIRGKMLLEVIGGKSIGSVVIVYPNNDPGWQSIAGLLDTIQPTANVKLAKDLPRAEFLGLLANAKVLIGNSSSGIIEAASLGTPVVNIGDRQLGRQRSENVIDVPWVRDEIESAVKKAMRSRFTGKNVYGGGNAGERIAKILADVSLKGRIRQKLIRY